MICRIFMLHFLPIKTILSFLEMKLSTLLINQKLTVRDVMLRMNDFCLDTVFVVDCENTLVGVITDGDLRRKLLKGHGLDDALSEVMNKDYTAASIYDKRSDIVSLRKDGIKSIPLLDEFQKVIGCIGQEVDEYIPIYNTTFEGNELLYLTDCIKKSWVSSAGEYVKKFEQKFSEFTGLNDCISTSSGSTALELAISLCNLNKNDEIIVPDLTFASPINSAIRSNSIVKLVDVDRDTMCINTNLLLDKITNKTKAIIIVNLYGYPVDILELKKNIPSHIKIIEDCAESLGSFRNNKHSGYYSDFATFSFYGNKTITTGEGGMLFCSNNFKKAEAKILRDHGMNPKKRYWHDQVGFNFRMTNLQGALGLAQMENIEKVLRRKKRVFQKYKDLMIPFGFSFNADDALDVENSRWLVTTTHENIENYGVEKLEYQLKLLGIDIRKVFYPLSSMPIYKSYKKGIYPNSSYLNNSYICLPSSPNLTSENIEIIVDKILMLLGLHNG